MTERFKSPAFFSEDLARKLFVPVVFINGVLFAVWTLLLFSWSVDDLLISARYARNLWEFGIWNWNADADRVEAYTTFTYTVIPLIGEMLNINPFFVLKLFGLFLYGMMIRRLYQYRSGLSGFLLSLTFVNLYFYVFIHIYGGFETFFFAFLLFEMALMVSGRAPFRERYFYVVLLLLPLTRPEGAAFALTGFFLAWRQGKVVQEKVFFGAILAIGAAYMAWRIWYFGHLLPNTFYVKSVHDSTFGNLKALFNTYTSRLMFITVFALIIYTIGNNALRILGTIGFLILLFLYYPSGLATDIGTRFFFQVSFYVILLGFLIVDQLKSKLAYISVCIFLVSMTWSTIGNLPFAASIYPIFHHSHIDIGQRLSPYSEKGYSVLVCEAGAIPYYSRWKSYDLLALADERLARESLTLDYLEDTHPDLMLVISDSPEIGRLTVTLSPSPKRTQEKIFKEFLAGHPEYKYVAASKRWFNNYTISIMDTTIADYETLKATLKENEATSNAYRFSFKDAVTQKFFRKDLVLKERYELP